MTTEIEHKGSLRSLRLPQGWSEGKKVTGNSGYRLLRQFQCDAEPKVKVCLFYRGLPLSEESSTLFRRHLNGRPQVIFSESQPAQSNTVQTLTELREVLDNTANNQILNNEDGFHGPHFQLTLAEVAQIGGRNALSVRGWYHDPGDTTPISQYWGLFYDDKSEEKSCPVQEIYFEAPNAELFEKYLPEFTEVLGSIRWRFDPFAGRKN